MSRLLLIFLFCSIASNAQINDGAIKGEAKDDEGQALMGITIILNSTSKGATTDIDGKYRINKISPRNYTLKVSAIGFKSQEINITVISGKTITKNFVLLENTSILNEVIVNAKTKSEIIKEQGFNVESVELKKIKNQSLDINKVLDHSPGVRVRTRGGIGSDFEYRLNGLSGRAIKFFIDEIPMDYFGSSYSINNIPVGLIDRIDIYKGVVPVHLGSDALGGAINLVTKQKVDNFLEGSISVGSFHTYQSSLHGKFRFDSGFTTKISAFSTYSKNNYKVWGQGVNYADESTGYKAVEFTKENPAERYNDDFKTLTAKVDVGFTKTKWADQFFIGILASDLKRGLQTGQTMGSVYGKARINGKTLMPNIAYKKKDFIKKGLDVNAFAGYSYNEGVLIDTSSVQYDWRGLQVGSPRAEGGETNFYGKSLYIQKNYAQVYRLNTNYKLPLNFSLGFNYLYEYNQVEGFEEFPNERLEREAYTIPQTLAKHFGGLSLETKQFDKKLNANIFLKYFGYNASLNELVYTTEYEVNTINKVINNFGAGFAASYKISPFFIIKYSIEKAIGMPTPTEAMGDGATILNNPNIEPEKSFNINLGLILGKYPLGNHGIKVAVNSFYNDTKDRIFFVVNSAAGTGRFINLARITGKGIDMEITYDYNTKLKLKLNATYTDSRNNDEFDDQGNNNIVYQDRLRNDPYFMTFAGLEYNIEDFIQKDSKLFMYASFNYIHEFYRDWPSLGTAELKSTIPSQLVFDAGFGYRFPSEKLTLAFDASNILNEQVYDNYLLQKPGRAFFLKATYNFLKQKNN